MRLSRLIGTALTGLLLITGKAGASGVDLHWLWDNQCAECHGHSSEFAHKFLTLSDGRLQGNHRDRSLRLFLGNHYTSNTEVDAVYQMLRAQVLTKPRFRQECGNCHGSAAAFVRQSLVLRDEVLFSRESGQPTQAFLSQHRNLGADDVDFYLSLLNRIAREVYRP
jgi:hypothetical protein